MCSRPMSWKAYSDHPMAISPENLNRTPTNQETGYDTTKLRAGKGTILLRDLLIIANTSILNWFYDRTSI